MKLPMLTEYVNCRGEVIPEVIDVYSIPVKFMRPETVAYRLSNLKRWAGCMNLKDPYVIPAYTVAHHTLAMCREARRVNDEPLARAALLHDVHEGILGIDLPSPLSAALGTPWATIKAVIDSQVLSYYGLERGRGLANRLHELDRHAAACEALRLGIATHFGGEWKDWMSPKFGFVWCDEGPQAEEYLTIELSGTFQ